MNHKNINLLEQYYNPDLDSEAINRSIILKKAIKKRIITKNKRIIDIGLGGGHLLGSFLEDNINENLFGLDISNYQFDKIINKFNLKRENLLVGDATDIEIINDSAVLKSGFDITLCTDVIEHVFNPLSLIDNLIKITKNNGYIIFNIPLELNLKARFLYLLGYPIHDPFLVGGHIRFFQSSHILNFFSQRSDIEIYYTDYDMWFGKESFIRQIKYKLANIFPNLFAGRVLIILKKK